MTDPNRLIDAYLDGTLSKEEIDQLEHDLTTHPKYADAFACAMMINELLGQRFEHESIATTMKLDNGEFLGDADLKLLQDDYEHAQPELVALDDNKPIHLGPLKPGKDDHLSFTEALSAIGYGIKCLVRAKPAPFIASAIAALLLLALWLINPFASTDPAPQAFTDNTRSKPAASTESTPRGSTPETLPVATLTNTHNAKWAQAEGASAPGSQPQRGDALTAGQRLNLTAGFAEITTNSGAVAILEAPATIELIDNNALHLHAGKMVGICATDSSKGFVVHTPHMDVTDLGTEFGVDVQGNNFTATVFTGEIELAFSGSDPQTLTQNQTARLHVDRGSRELIVEDKLAQGFDTLLPHRVLANALRNDPAMIAYYGFEAEDIVNGKLINRAQATQGKMDGTLGQAGKADSKPTLADGRRPGTHVLRFEAEQHDIVRVSAQDAQALAGLEQFTIGMWIRPDNTEGLAHHLLTWRGMNANAGPDAINLALVWNRLGPRSNTNAVLFHSDRDGSDFSEHQSADGILSEDGQWMHLVVSFDRGNRAVYVNGTPVAQMPRLGADKITGIDQELLFGAALCHLSETGSYFDGDLDELFILGRVMDENQVRSLYEGGAATK